MLSQSTDTKQENKLPTIKLSKKEIKMINLLMGKDKNVSILHYSDDCWFCLHKNELFSFKRFLYGMKMYCLQEGNNKATITMYNLHDFINNEMGKLDNDSNHSTNIDLGSMMTTLYKLSPFFIKIRSKKTGMHFARVLSLTDAGLVLVGLAKNPEIEGALIK